jgi:cytochrome c oxidase cbb3-type subunit 1
LFLSGVFVMAWNVWKTVRGAQPVNPAIPLDDPHAARPPVAVAPAVPATV